VALDMASMPSRPLLIDHEKGGINMNGLLGWLDEHYCYVCEELLNINEEHMEFAKKISTLVCPKCNRMYELELPITGDDNIYLRMIGYSGEE